MGSWILGIVLCVTAVNAKFLNSTQDFHFSASFQFGVATAAYQIEGGWDEDGKGPSIWDVGTHEYPEVISDRTNGDVASDSYHLTDRDIEMLKGLGVNFYRFSISWARILPTGDVSSLNIAGIRYYDQLITKLVANSIQPMVTMYHYDLPHELQKIGGMTSPLFPQYFEQYANTLYRYFGDRVKLWVTFNEPLEYCNFGYSSAFYPPFSETAGVGEYLCVDNTLKAHALAYRLYRSKYYKWQNGKIGIAVSGGAYYSRKNDPVIIDRALQYAIGWITHAIYSESGGYPEVMVRDIASNSLAEGRAWSRLPHMDANWVSLIRGSADFFGINYYSPRYVDLAPKAYGKPPSWENDGRLNRTVDPSWKRAKSDWLYSYPKGLEDILRWIRDVYNNVEVYITENGWSDDGELEDHDRVEYLKGHLQAISNAINDGCNVTGYAHWSLMDNFEWLRGYTERFGLYYVNITDPDRTRIPKVSADVYKQIIATRTIPS